MHFPIDDWYDWWRLGVMIICAVSFFTLLCRYRKGHKNWNAKTIDYWFSLCMWSIAGFMVVLEGIYSDYALTTRLVFVTAASLVTLKGLRLKGPWGGSGD